MIIKTAEFIKSAVTTSQFPKDNLPQIVFSGRSNVGKSSFINAILNRKKIAKVSQTPGKTRLVNFFLINNNCYFVDIPGYGYAKVNKQMIKDFQTMIEEYLVTEEISLTVLLLDIRRIPNEDDVIMYDYFKAMGKDILIVLTKADKLSNNQKFNQVRKIKQSLELREQDQVITFSAETMENRDKVLDIIGENVSRYQNG